MWAGVIAVVPNIIMAIIIVLIGFLVAWLAKHAIEELFKVVKIDNLLSHTGLDEAVERAGYKLNSGAFIGNLAGSRRVANCILRIVSGCLYRGAARRHFPLRSEQI